MNGGRARALKLLLLAAVMVAGQAAAAPTTVTTYAGGRTGTIDRGLDLVSTPGALAGDSVGNVYFSDGSLVRKVSPDGSNTVFAGTGTSGFSGDGGLAVDAKLSGPRGLAVDASGRLLIADTGNRRIRRVEADGSISTIAGTGMAVKQCASTICALILGDGLPAQQANFETPSGMAVAGNGDIFVADEAIHNVRMIDAISGVVSTIAGNGVAGFSGDGGNAARGRLNTPVAVATNAVGELLIADSGNNRIRKVNLSGDIFTTVGSGASGFSGDGGPAVAARLARPSGVAVTFDGSLLISDSDNHRVRQVDPAGLISTVAGVGASGSSGDGGRATDALLNNPKPLLALSHEGFLIGHLGRIRKVSAGTITTLAGSGGALGCCSEDGLPATAAILNAPRGLAVSATGDLFIADSNQHRVLKVDPQGVVKTIAGNGTGGFAGDGDSATGAKLHFPRGVAVDASGNVYIADSFNFRIRKVTPGGIISTVAGGDCSSFSGDGGAATAACLRDPYGVAVDGSGALVIADTGNSRIRRVDGSGIIQTIAGGANRGFSGDEGPATSAALNLPYAISYSADGDLYIADTFNNRIRVVSGGTMRTVAASTLGDGLSKPQGVFAESGDSFLIADTGNDRILRVDGSGKRTTVVGSGFGLFYTSGMPAAAAYLGEPVGVVGRAGQIFFAASDINKVLRVAS